MKSTTIASGQAQPELAAEAERRKRSEFLTRAQAALHRARQTGHYVDADVVLAKLEQRLAVAKAAQRASKE